MEQFTVTSQRRGFSVQLIPAVTKDIFVWIVGPQAVQCELFLIFNCAVYESSYLLTYLLTYVIVCLAVSLKQFDINILLIGIWQSCVTIWR